MLNKKMKKILYTATVVKTHIKVFHIPYLEMLKNAGFEVHVAAKNDYEDGECVIPYCDKLFDLSFSRNPFDRNNIEVFKKLKAIIEEEKYEMVHCHTPVAAVITRLASIKARKKIGTKVVYTAHGFHFYKGAPIKNWLLYFSAEWLCSFFTDCIITINEEDYIRGKKLLSRKASVKKISGIGVDLDKFYPPTLQEKADMKKAYDYDNDFVMVYAAEFIPRKNHQFFIKSMKELKRRCPSAKMVFAGSGRLLEEMKALAESEGLSDHIHFVGFRNDMPDLMKAGDVIISASIEEGFGINIVEGLATGLPAVASIVRGHKEMVQDGYNGFFFEVGNINAFCDRIEELYKNADTYNRMSEKARESSFSFSLENSKRQMRDIYSVYLKEL